MCTLLAVLCLALFSLQAHADENTGTTSTQASPEKTGNEEAPKLGINLRLDPVGVLDGIYGGEAELRISNHVGLALAGAVLIPTDVQTYQAFQLGLLATYFPWSSWDRGGWLLSPNFYWIPISVDPKNLSAPAGTLDKFALGANAGYQWNATRHLNVTFALGMNFVFSGPLNVYYASKSGVPTTALNGGDGFQPMIRFATGWEF